MLFATSTVTSSKELDQSPTILSSDYKRDPDGTLYVSAESYIKKMNESYERIYGTKPKEYSLPLEKNDHPELDNSTLVSPDEIVLFQSHIGCFQWCYS